MSYDIRLSVRVRGADHIYAVVARPEHDSPTYNLAEMFRKCMDWDFDTSEQDANGDWQIKYYPCSEVIFKVERGIRELKTKRKEYEQYNSPKGWGTIDGAVDALESLRDCIYETAESIPIECLYMNW